MRALSPSSSFEYILRVDRELPLDSPERTVWILRRPSIGERAQIQDVATSLSGDMRSDLGPASLSVNSGSVTLMTLRIGIVGVRNFLDEAGAPVTPKRVRVGGREVCDDAFLNRIPQDACVELVNAITDQHLGEELAGKSAAPSA